MNSVSLASSARQTGGTSQGAVAPAWHTAVVLVVLLCMSVAGAMIGNRLGSSSYARLGNYLLVIVMEWAIVAFIAYGVRRRGLHISDLVGGRWANAREVLRDLGIGLAFMLVCGVGALNGLGHLLRATPNETLKNLLPHSGIELAIWVVMSLTAGFCEETIFRGYLMRQFSALTGVALGGIVLQGIVFGASHGYQGWKSMLLIGVYGVLFGLLASWRRSLRPGMIAHGVQDTLGGLLWRYLMR
jgi:membrane protease YdiL (CAAX protease family)